MITNRFYMAGISFTWGGKMGGESKSSQSCFFPFFLTSLFFRQCRRQLMNDHSSEECLDRKRVFPCSCYPTGSFTVSGPQNPPSTLLNYIKFVDLRNLRLLKSGNVWSGSCAEGEKNYWRQNNEELQKSSFDRLGAGSEQKPLSLNGGSLVTEEGWLFNNWNLPWCLKNSAQELFLESCRTLDKGIWKLKS